MPEKNAELARSAIEAFNRHDYAAGLARFDPEVVWTVGAELLPDAGVYDGREGVQRFWDLWHETFEGFELVIDECSEAREEHVVTVVHSHGWGSGSGAEVVSPPFTQLFRFRDGLITHVWLHGRRETALRAAGLADA